jgi:hypothetical protein
MLCLSFASPLPAVRALAALTPLRRPATGSSGSITTSLVTRAICSTPPFARFTARATSSAALVVGATSDALTSDWFGGKPKRPFSSSAFRGSSFGPTDDEFLQFMRRYHEQANGLQPPTDHDMLHWKPSIHAVQETIKREGKPGGFIHYITSGGEVITPAHGSVISEEHVLMLQISQELTKRGDDAMAGILQAIALDALVPQADRMLDGPLGNGMPWVYWWNGDFNANAMGRAAKVRGVTKELKFEVWIEHPGTPDEKITVTLDTKAMRESAV